MRGVYQVISWLFMPLTMPLFALLIVFYTPSGINFSTLGNSLYFLEPASKRFFFNSFGLFGFIFPIVSIVIMRLSKQVESLELDLQRQRFIPLFLVGCYALMLTVLLWKFNAQVPISKHFFGLALSGVMVAFGFMLINLKTKISLHAGGVGMLLGFLFSYYQDQVIVVFWPLYVACIIAGLVISSRIALKKHTISQLFFGFILGFLITFTLDYISVKLF